MQIQPIGPLRYSQSPLNDLLREINAHCFKEGIYLVKRKSVYTPVIEHYGFAILGRYLKYFNPFWKGPTVIHKTNAGIHADPFDPHDWEKVETMPDEHISWCVERARVSISEAYDLLQSNCEHFARFVVTGRKESTQVQVAVGIGGLIAAIWLLSGTDH